LVNGYGDEGMEMRYTYCPDLHLVHGHRDLSPVDMGIFLPDFGVKLYPRVDMVF
jgi:hypothetical protein